MLVKWQIQLFYFTYLLSQQVNKLSCHIFVLLPSLKISPDKKHQGTLLWHIKTILRHIKTEIAKHFNAASYFMVFHMIQHWSFTAFPKWRMSPQRPAAWGFTLRDFYDFGSPGSAQTERHRSVPWWILKVNHGRVRKSTTSSICSIEQLYEVSYDRTV